MVVLNVDNADTRQIVEHCMTQSKVLINPLIYWDDEYTWWYIRHENIQINPLYEQGYCRVGCIGCPMAGKDRWRQFARYPKYKASYIRAFDKMIEVRKEKGLKEIWKDGAACFKWWMEDKNIDGQLSFDELGNISEDYVDYWY